MLKVLNRLQQSVDFWFIFATSFLFFLFRFPSFFEPYWYGDEGIYEVIGYALRHGRLLYQGIWDNKPPLLYLIYALGNGDQTTARILSFVTGLVAMWIFFLLSKLLFTNKKSIYIATVLFTLLFGLPLLEGNIANAENFMVLPSVAAAYCIARAEKKKLTLTRKTLLTFFLGGIFLGLSFLTKVVAVFDTAAFVVFLAILSFDLLKKNVLPLFYKVTSFTFGFIIPLLITIAFFAYNGALKVFLQSAFFSNIGYVSYGNQFIIPQGFLIIKLLLLGVVTLFLFIRRKFFSVSQLFIFIWLAFSVFNAFFSQRPYTHYLLVLVPSLCLFVAYLFEKQTLPTRLINSLILVILLIFLGKNFWYYSKTFSYYQNFISYLVEKKDIIAYQTFFDRVVPRDYALSEFLLNHMSINDTVFIWGNSGQIYKLSNTLPPGRFIVAYHITASNETLLETSRSLKQHNPKFVIILPNASSFPYRMGSYTEREEIDGGLIYEKVL